MNCEICGKSLTADNTAVYDICIDCWDNLPMDEYEHEQAAFAVEEEYHATAYTKAITRRAVREGLRVLLGGVALFTLGYVLLLGLFLI